jgi:hypothetical protein
MPTPRTIEARSKAAKHVADAIHDVETSINQTIATVGQLFIRIAEARLDQTARMPLTVGMAASEKVVTIASTAILAYRQAIEAHDTLSDDKARLGLATVAWGDLYNTVTSEDRNQLGHGAADTAPLVDEHHHLKVVA